EAATSDQAEVMLVDRRSNDQLALHVADDAAREHVRRAVRIEVVERVDLLTDAEDRELPSVDQRRDAGIRQQLVQLADMLPGIHLTSSRSERLAGRIWPRSFMNTTLLSARSLLTK